MAENGYRQVRNTLMKFGLKPCDPTVLRSWCTGLYLKAQASDGLRKVFSTHLPVSATCFQNATSSRVCQGLVIPMATLSWKVSGRKMIFALLLPKPSTVSTSAALFANETENRQSCSEQNWRPNGFLHLQIIDYFRKYIQPGKLILLTASKLLQKQFLCGVPARALCGFVRSTLRGLVRVTEGPRCFQWTAGTRSQPPDS